MRDGPKSYGEIPFASWPNSLNMVRERMERRFAGIGPARMAELEDRYAAETRERRERQDAQARARIDADRGERERKRREAAVATCKRYAAEGLLPVRIDAGPPCSWHWFEQNVADDVGGLFFEDVEGLGSSAVRIAVQTLHDSQASGRSMYDPRGFVLHRAKQIQAGERFDWQPADTVRREGRMGEVVAIDQVLAVMLGAAEREPEEAPLLRGTPMATRPRERMGDVGRRYGQRGLGRRPGEDDN